MADLRSDTDLAVAECRRLYPSTRYSVWRDMARGPGWAFVLDDKTGEKMVTVHGSTDERTE